ncbi:type 1 fimbrial protein [Pseudomonas arcuscaelestis]|uniref:type 1 fimbrial protein n=1 Tax=Pseudomonas arcuscaelestis TaxID=2710591 RepID=UPI001F40A476|nr:type 1 fimbrial protein [Pseudomonas arcuscaelestis]
MHRTFQVVGMAMLVCLNAVGSTAMAEAQGVIRFAGSIVEPTCSTSTLSSGWRVEGCSEMSRGTAINVREMKPQALASSLDNASVQVKLVADSNRGLYYDQLYTLVDNSGKAVTQGLYLITLTSP